MESDLKDVFFSMDSLLFLPNKLREKGTHCPDTCYI